MLDEAERRGKLRILRSDNGKGLLLIPGPVQAQGERVPVPLPEKVAMLRTEVETTGNESLLRLLALAYDTITAGRRSGGRELRTARPLS